MRALVVLDRCVNVLLAGDYNETLSARAWRMQVKRQPYWGWTAAMIDGLFFWQPNHCQRQFDAEQAARANPTPTMV